MTVEVSAGPRPVALRGWLHVPASAPPFPALLFLHGCADVGPRQDVWAAELRGEGYVVLVFDSFGARGLTRVCGDRARFSGHERAKGATIAHDAAAHADARVRVRAFLARELKGP